MRLLLIDDESDITEILENIIAPKFPNIKVTIANDVQTAIELIGSCDAIISDINIPNKDLLNSTLETTDKILARITGFKPKDCTDLVVEKPFRSIDVINLVNKLKSLYEQKAAS
jgi:CheY-like chemotaxis protein